MARYLYEVGVGPRYYMDGAVLYECGTGKPTFYVEGNTVYAYAGGKPTYWIDGNHLHPHAGTGASPLYFDRDDSE